MNSFGKNFRVEIFGESHGELIGATIDGVIPGIPLSEDDFKEDILRRKSGGKAGRSSVSPEGTCHPLACSRSGHLP